MTNEAPGLCRGEAPHRAGRAVAWCSALGAVLVAGTPPSRAATRTPRRQPFPPVREIRVPLEDLDVLLHGGTPRVLLTRDEYETLKRRAKQTEEAHPPRPALGTSAEYRIRVREQRAVITGTMNITVLKKGLHGLGLDISGVGLRRLELDGRGAPLGRADDGRLELFVEGVGQHRLTLDAVTPLQASAAQQVLTFRLPTPPATRLHVVVPGDVEVRSGAATIRRDFDVRTQETRLELLPTRGTMTLVMSLNSRLKRRDRVVMARSVMVDEITQAYERLHATISLDVLHRPVRDFRFAVPDGFEVTDIQSPDLSRWAVMADGGRRVAEIRMRQETTGTVVLHVSALRTSPDLTDWTMPRIDPLDVVGNVAIVGLLVEERLKARDVVGDGLIAVDTAVLVSALPKTVLEADAGEVRVRPLVAYYAPQREFSLSTRFFKPPGQLLVRSNTLLVLRDEGFEVRGGLAVRPREERLFAIDFVAPVAWDVTSVSGPGGKVLPFERYAAADGMRVHVRIPGGIAAGTESNVYFTARHVPPGWLDTWESRDIAFPPFAVPGAGREVGAIAVDARDDMLVRASDLEGLTPLDANEKSTYGLSSAGASLAYRYESRPFRARLRVERARPRLTAETYSFLRIKPDVLVAHYEVIYAVEQASTRQVSFRLPLDTPEALSVRGLNGTTVKEYSGRDGDSAREWTVLLAEARDEDVHLAINCQIPLGDDPPPTLSMPLVAAADVAYQSGLVSIEGSAELDISLAEHPRRVDVGELTDAEYRPGRRLLGAYGFVGRPPAVRADIARRRSYALPAALIQKAELATVLSADGKSQSSAHFRLKSKAPFVRVHLPEGSTLWSAMLNGKPGRPQQKDNSILLGLPSDGRLADLQVVYETPVNRLAFRSEAVIPAPGLSLHDSDVREVERIPMTDLEWKLYMPSGFDIVASRGSVTPGRAVSSPLAAVRVAEFLYRIMGGMGFRRGLVGACSAPLAGTLGHARLRSESYRGYESVAIEQVEGIQAEGPPPPPQAQPPASGQDRRKRILEKMRSIQIPEIDFRQANINDAVNFLRECSVEYDTTETGQAGKGVNMVLNLGAEAQVVQQAAQDPFAEAAAAVPEVPLVTFSARYISLLEALKIVTQVANLKFRIEGNVVMIVPRSAPDGEIVVRMYDVLPSVQEKMQALGAAFGEQGVAAQTRRAEVAEAKSLTRMFKDMGVQWPEGSSIKYVPSLGKMVVANTEDNHSTLGNVLSVVDAGGDRAGAAGGQVASVNVAGYNVAGTCGVWHMGEADKRATRSVKSLKIDLTRTGDVMTFHSLGANPELDLVVSDRRRSGALACALALLTLLIGVGSARATKTRKTSYVAGVLLFTTLVPAIPGLSGLALVLNASFYAACALVPCYLLAGLAPARRRRRLPGRTAAAAAALLVLVLPAFVCAGEAARAETKYVVEMTPRRPVPVPSDALVVPYDPNAAGPEKVLVPYEEFHRLWRLAHPDEEKAKIGPPVPYALPGAAMNAVLRDGDYLKVEARMEIDVFTDDYVEIPLPMDGAVLERVDLDGQPARLRAVQPRTPARAQQAKGQLPGRTIFYLGVKGKGRHLLSLAIRVKLSRQGGWRTADARLPVAPATSLRLHVPEKETEVRIRNVADRTVYRTEAADTEIHTGLGDEGMLGVRWRPKVSEGEIDRTLTLSSSALMDIEEDHVRLVWALGLNFRRGEHEFFGVDLPAGFLVEKVLGANVRGWEVEARPGNAGAKRLAVRLLQRSKEGEKFTVVLWRAGPVPAGETEEIGVPVVTVPGAVRHTGRLTIRRSPTLDARTVATAAVRRTDLAGPDEIKSLTEIAGEGPLGIEGYETYEFVSPDYDVRITVRPMPVDIRASQQMILRIAERERSLESRILLAVRDRAIHRAEIEMPRELELDAVTAPGKFEWSESEDGGTRVVTVYFARGLRGAVPIVVRGRLGQPKKIKELTVPALKVRGVPEQKGDIVVQADPAFDIRARNLTGLDSVLLRRVHHWLQENQRGLARLALRHEGPEYFGRLVLMPREPGVSCHTVTNIRVTDRAIEETVLLNFRIENAGIREVSFMLPKQLADAKISVPLLRQKTVTPVENDELVMVTLELQDEVMGELRVLVEADRLLTAARNTVVPPIVITGRTDRRYISRESAGRDEVVITEMQGLEELSRQQKEWASVASLLRGGTTRAFIVAPGARDPRISFEVKERTAVATVGARIGLAQTLLVVDAGGAYRARQTYHVDNMTEQFLETALPDGARLWTAGVAGELVKPVVPDAGNPQQIRIPLVKTAAGDLDYKVILKYGGRMRSLSRLRKVDFPLVRTANIGVELSQVELRLPRSHQWFRFGGTMRRIMETGDFHAGVLGYQTKLAKRLIRTAQYGNVFEKARAVSNLKSLQQTITEYQDSAQTMAPNDALNVELSKAAVVLDDAKKELAQVVEIDGDGLGNWAEMKSAFEEQKNTFARNVVFNNGANWDDATVQTSGGVIARTDFNGRWLTENSLDNPEVQKIDDLDRVQITEELTVNLPPPAGRAKAPRLGFDLETVQQRDGQAQGAGQRVLQHKGRGKIRRSQEMLAQRYQRELEQVAGRQAQQEVRELLVADRDQVGTTTINLFGVPVDQPPPPPWVPAVADAPDIATGLASLDVALPGEDRGRWESHRFTTPRGEIGILAYAVGWEAVDMLKRVGTALGLLMALFVFRVLARTGLMSVKTRRLLSTVIILVSVLGLLVGLFPIAALVLLIAAIVMRIRARGLSHVPAGPPEAGSGRSLPEGET